MKQQISFLVLNFSKQSDSGAITGPWGFESAEIKSLNSSRFHLNEMLCWPQMDFSVHTPLLPIQQYSKLNLSSAFYLLLNFNHN